MDRADEHVPEVGSVRASLLQNLSNAEFQFFSGLFRKSERDYSFRISTTFYQANNTLRNGLSLPGSRACYDSEMTFRM